MKRPLFILAGNGPYLNRGCEAIVRGTAEILRRHFRSPRFLVCSDFPSKAAWREQSKIESDPDITHVRRVPPFWGGKGIFAKIKRWVLDDLSWARQDRTYREIRPDLNEARAVLSVGGDTYSLDYGSLPLYLDLDDLVLRRGGKMILWGVSVGPFGSRPGQEDFMAAHLKRQTAIFCRESLTRAYLEKLGVFRNVHDVADPAFVLSPSEPGDAAKFGRLGETLGLNLSPLLGRYVFPGEACRWLPLAREIVHRVRREYDGPVLLIPHVHDANPDHSDHRFMERIVEDPRLKDVGVLPPGYSCGELKWIIARLRAFAGARTHAVIAGLSSCVPTLAFAYSVKAWGIHRDIFGNSEHCLGPEALRDADRVGVALGAILRDEAKIRAHLAARIPAVRDAAYRAGAILRTICEGA